jgi:AraC family ethanolamine operon transcriptional activator
MRVSLIENTFSGTSESGSKWSYGVAASVTPHLGQAGGTDPAASGPFPAGLIGRLYTHDLDQMHETAPSCWSEEWQQLGYGQLGVHLRLCCTRDMAMARTIWTPGLSARGPRAPDTITFYISFRNHGPACLRGRQIRPHEAVVLYPDEPTDFCTATPFDVFMLAVKHERLERHAVTVLGCPLSELRRNERLALPDLGTFRKRADEVLSSITDAPQRYSALLADPIAARAFETRVIDSVLGAVQGPTINVSEQERCRLAWKAQEYLRTHLEPELTVRDLCCVTGATARTLHRAFQEQFGTTPKAYLKMLRLNGARDDLLHCGLGTTVTDVAVRWGFLHLGWFSHDYRVMFGETPSRTLTAAHSRSSMAVSG